MKQILRKYVIQDPLTEDYLVSYIHGDNWSDDIFDVEEEALFDDITKARRVIKLIHDRYVSNGEDDELVAEIHEVDMVLELYDLHYKDTYD